MEQKRRGEGTESSKGVAEACANEYLFVLAKWTANTSQVLQKSRVWKEISEDILRIYTGRGSTESTIEQEMERTGRWRGHVWRRREAQEGRHGEISLHPPFTQLGEAGTGDLYCRPKLQLLYR